MFHLWRISLARSIMILRRASLMSSIFSRITFAEHGPTRFMLSTLAAMSAVDTRSKLVGMVICPVVRSFLECRSISILPMRPVFWSSRRSSSGPKSPSVCPKTAPITSGFSTTPSISNLACITYFIVNVWDVPVNMHLLNFCKILWIDFVNQSERFLAMNRLLLLLLAI